MPSASDIGCSIPPGDTNQFPVVCPVTSTVSGFAIPETLFHHECLKTCDRHSIEVFPVLGNPFPPHGENHRCQIWCWVFQAEDVVVDDAVQLTGLGVPVFGESPELISGLVGEDC